MPAIVKHTIVLSTTRKGRMMPWRNPNTSAKEQREPGLSPIDRLRPQFSGVCSENVAQLEGAPPESAATTEGLRRTEAKGFPGSPSHGPTTSLQTPTHDPDTYLHKLHSAQGRGENALATPKPS
ncbi:hypothetical protein STEG23_011363 [Scotinomys teguina]